MNTQCHFYKQKNIIIKLLINYTLYILCCNLNVRNNINVKNINIHEIFIITVNKCNLNAINRKYILLYIICY